MPRHVTYTAYNSDAVSDTNRFWSVFVVLVVCVAVSSVTDPFRFFIFDAQAKISQAEAATSPTSPEILYGFTAFCNEMRPWKPWASLSG